MGVREYVGKEQIQKERISPQSLDSDFIGEGVVTPMDGREILWIALGQSWSTVIGQKIRSQDTAWWIMVGGNQESRCWEPVATGFCIRRAAVR